jgi:hypothetical protein
LAVLNPTEKRILLALLDRLDAHHSQVHDIHQVRTLMNGTGTDAGNRQEAPSSL